MKIIVQDSKTRNKVRMSVIPSHTVPKVLKIAAKAFKMDHSKFILIKGIYVFGSRKNNRGFNN